MHAPSNTHPEISAVSQVSDKTRHQELSDAELDTIAGGKVEMQDIHFTTKMSKASP
jgi:hypothetical protein